MANRIEARLIGLEQRQRAQMTPIDRAYALVECNVPLDEWPDAELNAFCVEHRELMTLSGDAIKGAIERSSESHRMLCGVLWLSYAVE